MKIKFLFFIFSFLLTILIDKSQCIKYVIYDPSNTLFTKYPNYSPTYGPEYFYNSCSFKYYFWLFENDSTKVTSVGNPGIVTVVYLYYNSTHSLYEAQFTYSPNVSKIFNLPVFGSDGTGYSFSTLFECKDFNTSQIEIQNIGIFYSLSNQAYLLYNTIGIPGYVQIKTDIYDSFGFSYPFDDGYSIYNLKNMNLSDITASTQVGFLIGGEFINKSISSYYNTAFKSDTLINYFPNDWDPLVEISAIGKGYYPVFVFTQKSSKKPYFSMVVDDASSYQLLYKPIYEDNNGIVTYIATPKYPQIVSPLSKTPNYKLYIQNDNSPIKVFDKSLNIVDPPQSIFSKFNSTFVLVSVVPIISLDFSITNTYQLNSFRFALNNQIRDLKSPFGFCSGTNSAYEYVLELPISPVNILATISIFNGLSFENLELDINGYANDTIPPSINNYEFIYIENSKYLFKVSIFDQDCGVGSISFDGLTYIQISKYRVSGDIINGTYHIPIDFDLLLQFNQVIIYDLCDRSINIEFDEFLPSVPLKKFSVPFFSVVKYNVFKIKDISYLYNNLDVTSKSVGNIVYFTLDGADEKATLGLVIPDYNEFVGQVQVYSNKYFASWNKDIKKFQIEFIVPKGSRLGEFKFYFFSVSNYKSLSYMEFAAPSSYFSDDSQLIISKSNFDNIGPIITIIQYVPIQDGVFSILLTISDPINGFSSGIVIITGLKDNSVYKFNLSQDNIKSGNISLGVWQLSINLGSRYCTNQDYLISYIKLVDTGGQYSVFEFSSQNVIQNPNLLNNPLYLFYNCPTCIRYHISECTISSMDSTGPNINNFLVSRSSIDVGSVNRSVSFELQVEDLESGINVISQSPIVYITGENFEIIECVTKLKLNTTSLATFECTIDIPIGFGSSFGVLYLSVFNILNNYGLFSGFSTSMLKSFSLAYKIDITYSLNTPLLLESGKVTSKGGKFVLYGKSLQDISKITITDSSSDNILKSYDISGFSIIETSVISLSNLIAISKDFYVSVTTSDGITSNKLLVSPVIFNSYNVDPLPTNPPQQCLGDPICGGISHGTCNNQTGCVCKYPWRGKSCENQVIEPEIPTPNPNEPSTGIDIPDYKSLISIVALRELDINGNIVNSFNLSEKWSFTKISDLKSNYKINITSDNPIYVTTISATLEWFNKTQVIIFANQELEIYANSIKYSIEVSRYPFLNQFNTLQLIMSASINTSSSNSCSSKEFGDTTTGDNSNYINIQINNKSLYGRLIKRGIIDNSLIVSLSNQLLDQEMNAISNPTQLESFIAINIPFYNKNLLIDPDFSILLNSDSANSVCKSNSVKLSGAKIAGIVIGGFAFILIALIVLYSIIKRSSISFKIFISNFDIKLNKLNKE